VHICNRLKSPLWLHLALLVIRQGVLDLNSNTNNYLQ
jgi:hypothetical protein